MSDSNPVPKSRSLLAFGYLVAMFGAGLLLVYAVDARRAHSPSARASGEQVQKAPVPAPLVEPAAQHALEMVGALAEKTRSLGEQLAATRQRVQGLEDALVALRQSQVVIPESAHPARADEAGEPTDPSRSGTARVSTEAVARLRDEAKAQLERDLAGLDARRTEEGARVSLTEGDLGFAPGATALPTARSERLSQVAGLLSSHPDLKVWLRGYTDSSGAASRNLELSAQRARAVRDALVALGVGEQRIQTEGLGEAKPIASNATPEGRARNRRVEIDLTLP